MNKDLTRIGEQIRCLRKENGLSQDELANLSAVDRSLLCKIENGQIEGVQYLTISKIFSVFDCILNPIKFNDLKNDLHPFVKWAGGKTQLLNDLSKYIPKSYCNYYEPFLGGGALLFKIQPKSFFVNDINSDLIIAYNCFKNDPDYYKMLLELDKHSLNHSEEYYLNIRNLDRNQNYEDLPNYVKAARLIYLNKACFNGLYRVNSKGYFNVPSGKKTKVNCYDKTLFSNIKTYFKESNSNFSSLDFMESLKNVSKNDFVYLDPPYDTWDDKKSFTSYNKDSFNKDSQKRLFNVFKDLDLRGAFLILSNQNTSLIRELYKDYNIHIIPAKRMINSKGDGRGNVEEVIITNYEQ